MSMVWPESKPDATSYSSRSVTLSHTPASGVVTEYINQSVTLSHTPASGITSQYVDQSVTLSHTPASGIASSYLSQNVTLKPITPAFTYATMRVMSLEEPVDRLWKHWDGERHRAGVAKAWTGSSWKEIVRVWDGTKWLPEVVAEIPEVEPLIVTAAGFEVLKVVEVDGKLRISAAGLRTLRLVEINGNLRVSTVGLNILRST